jgi:site-specific DNA-cytosine methylase
MKVIGLTSGIGSMLIGAQQLGMEVLGNVEWRPYYRHTNSFENNFNAPMFKDLESMTIKDKEMMTGADIAFGHP